MNTPEARSGGVGDLRNNSSHGAGHEREPDGPGDGHDGSRDTECGGHRGNGTECTSEALDHWAYRNGVHLEFIRPGRPVENGYIESFNTGVPSDLDRWGGTASCATSA